MDDETKELLRGVLDELRDIGHQLVCLNDQLAHFGKVHNPPVEPTWSHLVSKRRPKAADVAWARRMMDEMDRDEWVELFGPYPEDRSPPDVIEKQRNWFNSVGQPKE